MTVNVYTYYENKIAMDSISRTALTKPSTPWEIPTWTFRGFILGAIMAMILIAGDSPSNPTLMTAAWAQMIPLGLGIVMDRATRRLGKFVRALRGEPLDMEDLKTLGVSY